MSSTPENWRRRPFTQERRAAISAALKGRKLPPEQRAKLSAAKKGRKLSPEHCAAISQSLLGHTVSPETRDKIGTAHTRHGHTRKKEPTPTYISWLAMISRCTRPNVVQYPYYGARGITVCARWQTSFENFLSDMGERPEGLSLDRINNDGNYEPQNCRWATQSEQCRNQRQRPLVGLRDNLGRFSSGVADQERIA